MSRGRAGRRGQGLLVAVALTVAGCLDSRTPSPAVPAPSASARPTPSTDPLVVVGGPSASPSADDRVAFATDDGLSLTVSLDHETVQPGGVVIVSATIRNDRPRAVTIAGGWCGAFVDVTARMALPVEPVGREWGGISGAWKAFALTSGFGPGGVPATDDVTIHGSSGPGCGDPDERTIGPGEIVTVESRLSVQIVDGVPALPGEVPLEISLLHDPVEPAPTPTREPPGSGAPIHGGGLSIGPTWSQLLVRTSVTVAGDAPHVVSLGEAVDGMLRDRRFANWLATMPARTWSVSNLFLQNNGKAEGIVPAGPSWEVDLFREVGVPRNWAIGFVDPFSGDVLNLAFCNAPCDR